jgi:hypothetical protein
MVKQTELESSVINVELDKALGSTSHVGVLQSSAETVSNDSHNHSARLGGEDVEEVY